MPQRRSAAKSQEGTTIVVQQGTTADPSPSTTAESAAGEEVRAPLSLEQEDPFEPITEETVPLAEYDPERLKLERHNARVKKWKESPFACGLTESTWRDEQRRESSTRLLPPDESGCLCCSAYICAWLGATRVGNMAVLKQSQEWVEEIVEDEETGETTTRRFSRPRLDIVVGPYWPMLVFVTYGIIFGLSIWTFQMGIWGKGKPPVLIFAWFCLTMGLIAALALTGCRDPGILYRTREEPPNDSWRWSDPADSYRPRNAWFDADTGVVVEGFDHTYVKTDHCSLGVMLALLGQYPLLTLLISNGENRCPWTGTAIGKKNMLSFQFFVCLVFVCMIMDIFILTGAF